MNTKTRSKQKKIGQRIMIALVTIILMGCLLAFGLVVWKVIEAFDQYEKTTDIDLPIHSISSLEVNYESLWEISNISATTTSNSNNLTVSHDAIYLITKGPDENIPTNLSIIAFDGLTSKVIWQINGEFGPDLFHNSAYLYATINGNGIVAYHPISGNRIWETRLPEVRGISHVTVTEREVFITAVPDKLFVLDASTGSITTSSSYDDIGYSTFLVKNNTAYWQQWPLNLVATNLQSGERNWIQSFEGGFEKTPVFAEDLIFVVTFGGQLFVLDEATGEIVWHTEPLNSLTHPERIVSNITIADAVVYYLTQDSQLRALNIDTGEVIGAIEFTPSLFTLGTNVKNYRYDVAANDNFVAVYFGDSDQLFSFFFLPAE